MRKYFPNGARKLSQGLLAAAFLAVALYAAVPATETVLTAANAAKKKLPIYSVETEEKKMSISFDAAWDDI